MPATVKSLLTGLGYLGRSDINRNNPICVASPKVAKASIIRIAVTGVIVGVITLTFANGNTAYYTLFSIVYIF